MTIKYVSGSFSISLPRSATLTAVSSGVVTETGLAKGASLTDVTVIVKEVRSPQVSVLGEVRKPGRYRIAQSATVLDAIALGGGFTEFAHRGRVVVLRRARGGVERLEVDVDRIVRRGEPAPALKPGDTVYVD